MRLGPIALPLGVLGLAVVVAFGGCHRAPPPAGKPSKACRSAEEAMDRATALGRFGEARALRAGLYAECGDRPELRVRDQRLVDAEAARARLAAASAEHARSTTEVVRAFLAFVADQRGAPERSSNAPHCEVVPTPPSAATAATRWCVAHRELGTRATIEIRYAAAEPQAFRFSVVVDGPLSCASVEGRQLRSWEVAQPGGRGITRARCALEGRTAGLTAVVSGGEASTLYVTSERYLELDPHTRALLDP